MTPKQLLREANKVIVKLYDCGLPLAIHIGCYNSGSCIITNITNSWFSIDVSTWINNNSYNISNITIKTEDDLNKFKSSLNDICNKCKEIIQHCYDKETNI